MKKFLSVATCLAIGVSLFAMPASAASKFSDVKTSDWYYEAVEWAAENGITAGDTNGNFLPGTVLSNAQAIQFIYNSKGEKTETTSDPWYAAAQAWGIEKGYITEETNMKADCSRLEFVEMLYKAAGSPATTIANPFNDTDSAAAIWAYETKLAAGDTNGNFLPNTSLKRSTVAQFLLNASLVGMANPMVKFDSLDVINSITGGRLCQPAVMGVTDQSYYIIQTDPKIAEYDFSVNGISYIFRFSSSFTDDISGISAADGKAVFSGPTGETQYYNGDSTKAACRFTVDGQYVLVAKDCSSMSADTFKGIADEMLAMVVPEESDGDTVGMPNPMKEYSSLEEINNLTFGRLCKPAVMGVTDETYYIIDSDPQIAQYNFTLNGISYNFRFSGSFTDDISGIYVDGNTVFSGGASAGSKYYDGDSTKAANFFTVDGQYVLIANDCSSMTMDTFKGIADELFTLVVPEESDGDEAYSYVGSWHETIAGRGMADITCEDGTLHFSVTWPNSAAEVIEYTFSGSVENGVLTYNDAVSTSTIYGTDGKVTSTTTRYKNGTGKVTFNEDGTFTWIETGYNDEGSVFAMDK